MDSEYTSPITGRALAKQSAVQASLALLKAQLVRMEREVDAAGVVLAAGDAPYSQHVEIMAGLAAIERWADATYKQVRYGAAERRLGDVPYIVLAMEKAGGGE